MTFGVEHDYLSGIQRMQAIRLAGLIHEFHLEGIGRKDFNYRSDFSSTQADFWNISDQRDRIEQMEWR